MVRAVQRPSAHALSVDVAVCTLIAGGPTRAVVHSVFRHVVNLATSCGRLVSLASRDHDDAPWSVRVDVDDWTRWALEPGALAYADRLALTIGGGGRVELAGARRWDAAPVPMSATAAQLAARAEVLARFVDLTGVPGGALTPPAGDPFAALVAERIRTGLSAIEAAALADRGDAVEAAAATLLGLGPGLTPAGDDALTGLALVAARPGSLATSVSPALRRVLHEHGGRTTDVSRATVAAAVEGRARQRLLDLVDALVSRDDPDPTRLCELAQKVIAIGHTSGTDVVFGVLAGIQLEIQRRGSACLSPH